MKLSQILCLGALLISGLVRAVYEDGLALVIYEANAEVNIYLTSKHRPGEVIAQARANPLQEGGGGTVDFSLRNLGHPGTLKNRDSEIVIMHNALEKLREDAEKLLKGKLQPGEQIKLEGAIVGIAGFDFYKNGNVVYQDRHTGLDRNMTKMEYVSLAARKAMEDYHFILPDEREVEVVGDHTLIGQAAQYYAGSPKQPYKALQLVQLTSCAVGYRTANGMVLKGSSKSPENSMGGGTWQLGDFLKDNDFSRVPDNCTAAAEFTNDVLMVLSKMPIVHDYNSQKDGSFLAFPDARVRLYSTPTKKSYPHIFRRWKQSDIFFNEPGIAALWALEQSVAPAGVSQESFQAAQLRIKTYMDQVMESIAEVVDKLVRAGERTDRTGNTIPLVLLGEFPLYELGFKDAFEGRLNAQDVSRLNYVTVKRLGEVVSKGGLELMGLYSPYELRSDKEL